MWSPPPASGAVSRSCSRTNPAPREHPWLPTRDASPGMTTLLSTPLGEVGRRFSHVPKRSLLARIVTLLELPEEREQAVIDEQRAVILARTRVVGGIGFIVVPFTILMYLASL